MHLLIIVQNKKKNKKTVFTKWRSSHRVTKWQIYTTGILCVASFTRRQAEGTRILYVSYRVNVLHSYVTSSLLTCRYPLLFAVVKSVTTVGRV